MSYVFDDGFVFVLWSDLYLSAVVFFKVCLVVKAFETFVTKLFDSTEGNDVVDDMVVILIKQLPMCFSLSVFSLVHQTVTFPQVECTTKQRNIGHVHDVDVDVQGFLN